VTSSPQGHPTPPSHASSPTTVPSRSPMIMQQGGMTPPTSAVLAQGQAQQYHIYPRSAQQPPNPGYYQIPHQPSPQQQQRPPPPSQYQSSPVLAQSNTSQQGANHLPPISAGQGHMSANAGHSASAYYPSPFQKHIDQLGKLTPVYPIELCSS